MVLSHFGNSTNICRCKLTKTKQLFTQSCCNGQSSLTTCDNLVVCKTVLRTRDLVPPHQLYFQQVVQSSYPHLHCSLHAPYQQQEMVTLLFNSLNSPFERSWKSKEASMTNQTASFLNQLASMSSDSHDFYQM